MKRWLILLIIIWMIVLKTLIPSNALLQRKLLAFLGLERETVQALGHKLYEASP